MMVFILPSCGFRSISDSFHIRNRQAASDSLHIGQG
jgi:hypothetical protein